MDHPKFVIYDWKEESISLLRVIRADKTKSWCQYGDQSFLVRLKYNAEKIQRDR